VLHSIKSASKVLPSPLLSSPKDSTTKIKTKLLDQVRIALRTNHYSRKTEEAYLSWMKQFILKDRKKQLTLLL